MATSNTATGVIVKLLVVSLLVGLALSFFDVSPEQLLASFGDTVKRIFEVMVSMVKWTVPYMLIGAVVVVPIWLIIVGVRFVRQRGSKS